MYNMMLHSIHLNGIIEILHFFLCFYSITIVTELTENWNFPSIIFISNKIIINQNKKKKKVLYRFHFIVHGYTTDFEVMYFFFFSQTHCPLNVNVLFWLCLMIYKRNKILLIWIQIKCVQANGSGTIVWVNELNEINKHTKGGNKIRHHK